MHKRTHISIARAIFRKLNLPRDYEKIFIRAIVEPDNWRWRKPRYKHHYPQYNTILENIKQARRAYINGNISTCLWHLGIALHLIQDAFIPSPRTRELRKIHAHLERKMESYKSESSLYINESFIISSPKFIKSILSSIKWIYNEEDLEMIVKVSVIVTLAVFGSKDPPSGLHEKYRMLKENHNKRVLKASIISLISIIVGIILTLLFISSLNILSFYIIFFIFPIIPSLIFKKIVSSDKEFYEVKEEADWYGIK